MCNMKLYLGMNKIKLFLLLIIVVIKLNGFELHLKIQNCLRINLKLGTCLECQANYKMSVSQYKCLKEQNHQQKGKQYEQDSKYKMTVQNKAELPIDDNGKISFFELNPILQQNKQSQNQIIHSWPRILQLQSQLCIVLDPSDHEKCLICKQGYQVNDSLCEQIVKNCLQYDLSTLQCLKCKGNILLQSNICNDIMCILFQYGTEKCLQCETSYQINSQGICEIQQNTYIGDANCNKRNESKCIQCIQGFSLTIQNKCVQLSQGCMKINPQTNKCIQCHSDFYLTDTSQCQILSSDPYCRTFSNKICKQCYDRYYLLQNKCQLVNQYCKNYTSFGKCNDCYPSYTLNIEKGTCTISIIPYCRTQINSSICLQCSKGFFLNLNSQCQIISPLCKTSNSNTGECLSCYQGYALSQKTCKVWISDPNCKNFDSLNNKCLECSNRYFLKDSKCVMISPLCKGFNAINGMCTECYQGYKLMNGECKVFVIQLISNCKVQQGQNCIVCSDNFYFDKNGQCLERNPLCKTFDKLNGNCTSCYPGYSLQNGNCIISSQFSIQNCESMINKTVCASCYNGYDLINGKCQISTLNCKQKDKNTGYCSSCYNGYILGKYKCYSMQQILSNSKFINIQNCLIEQKQTCSLCMEGFTKSQNGFLCI